MPVFLVCPISVSLLRLISKEKVDAVNSHLPHFSSSAVSLFFNTKITLSYENKHLPFLSYW